MKALSLYAGIGGEAIAAHAAGFEHVAFCEADPYCRKVLARHWPEAPCFEVDNDVTVDAFNERGIPLPDLISGGPPCQGWSLAGKRAGHKDPRHRWPEMLRIVAEFRPAWVVVENVPGFRAYAARVVRTSLERLGYEVWPPVEYPVSLFGAPHERMRCFVVAHANVQHGIGRAERPIADGERGTAWNQPGRHDAENGGPMAHAASLGIGDADVQGHADSGSVPTRPLPANGSHPVGVGQADANRAGRGERRRAEPVRPEHAAAEHGREDVADAHEGDWRGRSLEPGRGPEGRDASDGTGEAMGDAANGRPRRGEAPGQGGLAPQPDEGDCEAMGHAACGRCQVREERDGNAPQDAAHGHPCRCHPDGPGCAEDLAAGVPGRAGFAHHERQPPRDPEGPRYGRPEPRLGGDAGGPAGGLDGAGGAEPAGCRNGLAVRWPMPPGPEQWEWEPPRLTSVRTNRVNRLKALGNIAVPVQLYPIFAAIAAVEATR